MIHLPPVTPDEYRHLMRLLGAPGDIGPRSLGVGLTGAGVMSLRARFTLADPFDAAPSLTSPARV